MIFRVSLMEGEDWKRRFFGEVKIDKSLDQFSSSMRL